MNHLRHATFCAMVTAATLFAAVVGHAGEPIIVPSEKPKAAPSTPDGKLAPRDVFRFGDKGTAPSGFDVTVPIAPSATPLDPREQKRRRLDRLERENWMVVGKGELQAEEDEKNFLNVRDYSLESLEKEDNRGNLMFRNLSKDSNQRIPGQFRSSLEPLRPRGPGFGDNVQEESENSPRLQQQEPERGAHISADLNFNKMFEPRAESDSLTPKFNKSDLTLQRLLSGGSSSEAFRERKEQSDAFRNFLDNRGSARSLTGPSDPINFGSDFTRQPINPTTPQPLGSANPGTVDRFGSASSIPRPGSPLAGGVPSPFAGAPTPAGFSAGPLLAPRAEPVRPTKQMTFDVPRRKF